MDRSASGVVLVVDDDHAIRRLAARMLEREGFVVHQASDGAEAVDVLRERLREINLVLLDLTMPGMSGRETLDALRSIRPDIAVLVSSGYTEEEAGSQLGAEEGPPFIQKPYRSVDLVTKIRETLSETD